MQIDTKIEHDLLWQRMKDVVPSLARALTTGTSEEWHDGARETLSSRASRRIKLAGWTPAVQERTGVTRPWSNLLVAPATAREATRDLEM